MTFYYFLFAMVETWEVCNRWEYVENIEIYEGSMKKYEESIMNYAGNTKEYYVEGSGAQKNFKLHPLYRLWKKTYEGDMKKYVGYMNKYVEGSETWKNSELSSYVGSESWKIPRFTTCLGSRTWKSESPSRRMQLSIHIKALELRKN